MKVIVLGSGVIGVTTAYFLAMKGAQVTVIDRQPEPSMECSFANGGQLSYSHVEPWANPGAVANIIRWLGKNDAPLIFRMRADPMQWQWGIRFLMNCRHSKSLETSRHMLRLSLYSKEAMKQLESDEALDFNHRHGGILHIFRKQQELDMELKQAVYQETLGCPYTPLTPEACLKLEPALAANDQKLVGGIHFPVDESGNIHTFTRQLAEICKAKGVVFHYNTTVEGLQVQGNRVTGVHYDGGGMIEAASVVLAFGASSPQILKRTCLSLPIYPMKGYSMSFLGTGIDNLPQMSITDQSHKIVYSRLGDIVRVAGTAEFAGYNYDIRPERIRPIKEATLNLFPQLRKVEEQHITSWACLRPQTPDGAPILGKTKVENLYFNTGHGTLGWTLACGSARVVSDIVMGKTPEIDLTGFGFGR